MHIHHIIPLAVGGTNRVLNLVRLCNECHAKAHGNAPLIKLGEFGRKKKVSEGKRRPGRVPYGYKQGCGETYEIHEDHAEVIRLIFRLRYLAEYSTINIATILNYLAISSAQGIEWKHPTIAKILENPIYFGEALYNGEAYGKKYVAILDDEYKAQIERFNTKYEGTRVKPRRLLLA